MIRITDILDKIVEYNPDADLSVVDQAYIYSARVHHGQVRLSGEPYLSHPLEVAYILAEMNLDVESIAAGLLHDVIEDTHATADDIREIFGSGVTHIVEGVTKLSKISQQTSEARQAESLKKMILAMADDIRVIMIKLADRIHNMRTLQFHKKEASKKRISKETIDIYSPIAARLGIYWIKNELENIAFMHLNREEYDEVDQLVSKSMEGKSLHIDKFRLQLEERLNAAGIKAQVKGRVKQHYSIYNKMKLQDLEFHDIYDIIALRVIVETNPLCYEVLGIIHSLWNPIPKKFKDYIGMPKSNMYQSLHTTVHTSKGSRVEIQIRTKDMDQVAKSGIAAHWSYKEGKRVDDRANETFAWIQNLVENQENFRNPEEFLENVRIDLFPDEIYVFSPMGDIKTLPKGATPVDFAFVIHTEVGAQCIGSKVDGRMVPLHHRLKTGNMVEIITQKGQEPSKDWLNFVKTVKARTKIRAWINAKEKDRSIALGREMCEKAFEKNNQNYNALTKSGDMKKAIQAFGFKTLDDLIASVGFGKITPIQVLHKVIPDYMQKQHEESILKKFLSKTKKKKIKNGVIVKGSHDILIRFGKCCQPVPGDPIIGYITQGQGVTVHRVNCINALKLNPERQIDVTWNEELAETYPVKITVHSYDRSGLLADVTAIISKAGANILSAKIDTNDDKTVDSLFTLAVENTDQLSKVLASLNKVKKVISVRRMD